MKIPPKQLDLSKDFGMRGGRILLDSGSDSSPSLTFKDSQNTGLVYKPGSLGVTVNGELIAHFNSNGSIIFPTPSALKVNVGSTDQRPNGIEGMIRYNSDTKRFEGFENGLWTSFVSEANRYGVVQIMHGAIPAMSSTARIPYDSSAPEITEGVQLVSRVFTPLNDKNHVVINAVFTVGTMSGSTDIICAVFRDNLCIGSTVGSFAKFGNNDMQVMAVLIHDIPNTMSPITYQIRVGSSTSTTWYVNTNNTNTLGGTLGTSAFTIEEVSH